MSAIRPVILSGGAGARLWPLSSPDLPKQFAPIFPTGSLFAQTLKRFNGHPAPFLVISRHHIDVALTVCSETGIEPGLVITEPVGRNTAPAAVVAALCADPDEVLVLAPSDHLISDDASFLTALDDAAEMATAGSLVTFGIAPSRPDTGYGYIELGDPVGAGYQVNRFKEKPSLAEAERLVSDGQHVWNSGIFVMTAEVLLGEAQNHCPQLVEDVEGALTEAQDGVMALGESFGEIQKISFDHAIVEKTTKAVVMPIDVGWNDVGSYEALWDISPKDDAGNVTEGDVNLVGVSDSYVRASSRTVSVAGVDGIVVVETPDAVLVVPKDKSQLVRDLVAGIEDGSE